jgi:hypothetical protein
MPLRTLGIIIKWSEDVDGASATPSKTPGMHATKSTSNKSHLNASGKAANMKGAVTRAIPTLLILLLSLASPSHAEPTKTPQMSKSVSNLSNAIGMNELKIEMSESRLKMSKNPKALNDLVNALEDYLNTTCMTKLPQTLAYTGNPTDPMCIARVERLLELHPGNPVATCTRDGIAAKSCIEAYRNQRIHPIPQGSTNEDIDPSLRVGLSETTLDKIGKVEETLAEVNRKYQNASTPEEKKALINDAATLYDQALSMACKLSSVALVSGESDGELVERAELAQARERLMQVPAMIRKDYQREMEEKALLEMGNPKTSEARKKEIQELIKVIQDPTALSASQTANMDRTRFILEKCANLIDVAVSIIPDLPAAVCYREGWYTPQCVVALKRWRAMKQQEQAAAKGTVAPKSRTPSIISTF